jgi:hypothetical protein
MRHKIMGTFVGIAEISFLIGLLSSQTRLAVSTKPINTTLCEIVQNSKRFDGKKVRFIANFKSDGIENSVLTDTKCGRGILPFVPDEVEHHPDIEAYDRATDTGRLGTMDRRIVAIFTGRFVRKLTPSHARFNFILEIERIEDLQVTMVDLRPHVPK